ncbi:peptide MFS transporter [Flavobacterium sp. J49]|uniref:peptide MFS transporter n=1 Tax=Flavobacterium sp. J49 TaxID=2718534 RepID=UPI0015942EEB|nr:peptide MFS transporter [Flavobacterium sp. J49]MBF6641847.1 peptide MFS transporter [Flavobacterium sp. J49]NIC03094.1 peptide MFS transporter [Flavobacterium sp. J49]
MEKDLTIEQIQNFEGKYPKQLWYLFFSEMWERFCFYGMRGMLTFFMVDQLLMNEKVANLQYGATQAFVYAFTFIGGLFADKILGYRKSLFWGGIMMIVGSIILAINPQEFFFLGISFTVIGTGFFKPNISTMVGTLYKANDTRRDAGFSLFYSGINIGALLGGYACIYLGKNYSWNLAFGLAGIVMTISLLTFVFTQKSMADIGISPLLHLENSKRKLYEYATYIGTILAIPLIMAMVSNPEYTDYFMYTIGPITLLYLAYEMRNFSINENKKLLAAMVFIIFSILFWAFFEQSGGSLSLFAANNLDNDILGLKLDPNGVNNAANSLFVIIFAPLLGIVWIWLSSRKKEPNTVVKFGLGFLFLALAFYTFYTTRFFANAEGLTSLEMFTLAYFIITFGELCLSPIGLSIMTKLAPVKLQAVMMGMWFLASAYGQYAAGILGAGMASADENASKVEKLTAYTDGYNQLAIYALVAGLVLIAISPLVKKLMQDVK